MAPSLTKKSDGSGSSAPAWHPNLRIVEQLPDTKVVRTAFFVNGFAILVAIVLALYLGHQEWKLHGVNKEISDWQHTIDQYKKASQEAVMLYGDFKAEEAKTREVADYVVSKPVVSEIVLRLGAMTPKKIALDSLDFKDTGLSIKATIKGAPDRASGDASAYEKQLRADKVLGPMFGDVNLLQMTRNPATNRLVIVIFCSFKKGYKKT
jgi:hypothetical protein